MEELVRISKKKSQKEIKQICRHIPGNNSSEEDKEREPLASTWAVLALKMGEGDIDYLRHDIWGTHAASIDQFKLINQAWRCIGIYAEKKQVSSDLQLER